MGLARNLVTRWKSKERILVCQYAQIQFHLWIVAGLGCRYQ